MLFVLSCNHADSSQSVVPILAVSSTIEMPRQSAFSKEARFGEPQAHCLILLVAAQLLLCRIQERQIITVRS